MKDILLGVIAALLLGGAFLLGRAQQSPEPSPVVAPVVHLLEATSYDAGKKAVVSLYNPDGRLLKFFELVGPVEKTVAGELVFETLDGKKVRTNASYILEGQTVTPTTTATK